MCLDFMVKYKDGGIDVIQTGVFWNGHGPEKHNYNFAGKLGEFLRPIQGRSEFANLNIHIR